MGEPAVHTVEAPRLIRFETRDPVLSAARTRVREVLGGLAAGPGEVLHGVVEGPDAAGTDLDNALLHNIGGRIGPAARNGVVLERRTAPAASPTSYRYRLAVPVPELPPGVEIARFHEVPVGPALAWPRVWAALRTSGRVEIGTGVPSGAVGVALRLGAPGFGGTVDGELVKGLVDGVVTALHAHGDRATLPIVAAGLAVRAGLPEDVVSRLRIDVDRSAGAWTLSGRVVALG